MTPFWVLQTEDAPSSVTLTDNKLIFENRYFRRVVSLADGITTSITDGDGTEALSSPLREGELYINEAKYTIGGECDVHIKEEGFTQKSFNYTSPSYNTHSYPYPAPGKVAKLIYTFGDIQVTILYEIFDNMPVMRKTLYVKNLGDKVVTIDTCETEALCLTDEAKLRFYLESDYAGGNSTGFSNQTSIFYEGNIVSAHFDMGPDYDLKPGETFRGMQVYELFCQSVCFDHRMNEVQNMYRRVAPWICEAPLFMHLISDDSKELRDTADMLSELNFDMIIQSFGSGINMESDDDEYISRVKSDYDYVHKKGLKIGGYTLAIIRDYQPMNHDCATNGDHNSISRCLCTKWSEGYWNKVLNFLDKTGSDFIEIDGPYHFYTCTGNQEGQTEHLHKGLNDSRYMQWLKSTVEIYTKMRDRGIYINAPDWLFLSGTNKCGIGYEEIGFSQPRITQLAISRIYNYMGTYHKTPSMGWGFLPIEEYHGGSTAAKFEPLSENLADYDWALAQAAASGVWPTVRGKKLYDTKLCKQVVKYWSDVIHRHRRLLNSNTIHVYPPKLTDNFSITEDIDVILQENHTTPDKLFLMVCNQTNQTRTKALVLPAFYTGLTTLERPSTAPQTGSFDNVNIPSFGSWPPVYPESMENELCDYTPSEDSGVHMALFEHDLPEKRTEAFIDTNGNLILNVTLKPMSYTFYVGYEADTFPENPVAVPDGKPFGCTLVTEDNIRPEATHKIDFEAIKDADSVEKVLLAMDLPTSREYFDGNKVLLRTSTYEQIHQLLHKHQPETAMNTVYGLAYVGLHTTTNPDVCENEVWLLEGWSAKLEPDKGE